MKISWAKVLFLVIVGIFAASLAIYTAPAFAQEAGGAQAQSTSAEAYKLLGAGLAVGLAGIGGGYAVGVAGASAISAIAEKPEMSGNALLIVALGEGIAIYGFVVALLLMFAV